MFSAQKNNAQAYESAKIFMKYSTHLIKGSVEKRRQGVHELMH